MYVTAQTIADHLNGEIIGDPSVKVSSVAKIEQGKEGSLCFLANPKYEHYLYQSKASIVLINKSFEPKEQVSPTLIKVDNAYEAIASILDLFNSLKSSRKRGRFFNLYYKSFLARVGKGTYIGNFTYIGKKAKIGRDCQIYPQVFIGDNVTIGDNVVINPGVKIYHDCKIGNDCIIHANAVIGSDGFGFAPLADGSYKKIPQTGIVIVEDNVEIGANTTIDRSTMGATIIHKGVKMDNLIQIAHNVEVGHDTVIAAQTGIAGSAKIGSNCMLGGQAGVVGHVEIADHTTIAAKTGVIGTIKESGRTLMGYPAIDYKDYLKAYSIFKNIHKNK